MEVLCKIYNICLLNRRIPRQWKISKTIHKREDLRNFRPISLQLTIYKILAGVLAKRFRQWIMDNGVVSSCQKGFLPYDGCFEHNYVLRSVMEDSKRRNRNVRIAWLDLANAFGSVPHDILWNMLERLSVPQDFRDICREFYTDSFQIVCSERGETSACQVRSGIKQGCPLSPLLFNCVMEGLVRGVAELEVGYEFKGGGGERFVLCVLLMMFA